MDFSPQCRATAIGSFPHPAPAAALDLILEHLADIPVWPQLPQRAFIEGMCPQYSEGLPAVLLDENEKSISVDTGDALAAHVEKFYEQYLSEDLAPFVISGHAAPGLHAYLERLAGRSDLFAAKGHTTGPVTWGLTVCDQDKRSAWYNDMLRDGLVKGLARKAQWQALQLKKVNDRVIVFIDEPYLQSFGSAAVPLREDETLGALHEVIDAIHQGGALAGIHVCGNTDWGMITRTGTDIINFDAFEYAEALALYPREIRGFLENGGALAWGIVPSTEAIDGVTLDGLVSDLRRGMGLLVNQGIAESLILERALITPSCGGGSLNIEQNRNMLTLTAAVSRTLRGEQ